MKIVASAVLVWCTCAWVGCGGGQVDPSGAAGSGGAGASSPASSASSSTSATSGGSSDCLPTGCDVGWGHCRGVTDTCGNAAKCECLNSRTCVRDDLCCLRPDVYGYQGVAEARCAAFPGHADPYFCGAIYAWDPVQLDAGTKVPWLTAGGLPVDPSAEPPPYCVTAPYQSGSPDWILWCCEP